MKRRSFITNTAAMAMLPLFNSLPINVFGANSVLGKQLSGASKSNRVLVIILLDGGNDGLNTIIPLDQYDRLYEARRSVLIPEDKVLPLNGTAITGLHPAMKEIQQLYNNNMMTVVQGAGYPNPIFSHFRANDMLLTGTDSTTVERTGWLGRLLDNEYPNFPVGYPNEAVPYPLAVTIGSVTSKVFQSPLVDMGISIASTSDFYDLVIGNYEPTRTTPAGKMLSYIRTTAIETNEYMGQVKLAAKRQGNLSKMYPEKGDNPLADQLKVAAQLIGGELGTKVYMVTLDGFDTHGSQVEGKDTSTGKHAGLLRNVSQAVAAFQDDLRLMNKQDDVLCMTLSEFGRRIKSNASYGTDHGSSAPVMLFGTKLKGGFIGTNPVIPPNAPVYENLTMQHDFRSIYASVLKGWLNVPDETLNATLLGKFPTLPLFA